MREMLFQHKKITGSFLCLMFLALLSVIYSWRQSQLSFDRYREARHDFQQLTSLYHQSTDENEFLAENIGVFQSQLESGALGEVTPMDWIEALEHIRLSLNLKDFFYEINPAEVLGSDSDSSLTIQLATVNFQSAFKHDEALFQFFNQLESDIGIPYQISWLEIVRVNSGEGENEQLSLRATGEIIWLAIVPLANEAAGV